MLLFLCDLNIELNLNKKPLFNDFNGFYLFSLAYKTLIQKFYSNELKTDAMTPTEVFVRISE